MRRAGDIGLFKIVSEAGVAQGVRRIEAVTGAGALDYLRRLEDELARTGDRLKAAPFEVAQRVDKLLAEQKALDREIDKLKQRLASGGGARDLLADVVTIKGIKVLAASVEVDDAKVLRDTGDQLRDKLGSGVVVLAGHRRAGGQAGRDGDQGPRRQGLGRQAARRDRRACSAAAPAGGPTWRRAAARTPPRCRPRSAPRASGSRTTPEVHPHL